MKLQSCPHMKLRQFLIPEYQGFGWNFNGLDLSPQNDKISCQRCRIKIPCRPNLTLFKYNVGSEILNDTDNI